MVERKYYVVKTKKSGKQVAVLFKSDFKKPIYESIIDGFKNKILFTEVY